MQHSMSEDESLASYLYESADPTLFMIPPFEDPPTPDTMDRYFYFKDFPSSSDFLGSPAPNLDDYLALSPPPLVPDNSLSPMSDIAHLFTPNQSPLMNIGDFDSPFSTGSTFDHNVALQDDVLMEPVTKVEVGSPAPLLRSGKSTLPKYNCKDCGKELYTKNRRQHAATHNPTKSKYECTHDLCTKSYTRFNDMQRHVRSAHEGRTSASNSKSKDQKTRPCDACRRPRVGNESCECGYIPARS